MRKPIAKFAAALGAVAALGLGGAGIAAGGSGQPGPSRLDDGKDLLSQAKISETQAIHAAQSAASGDLNEVDLEHYNGRLAFNVDVGSKDVKVDAETGKVLAAPSDD